MDLYCQVCGEPYDVVYVNKDMDRDGEPGDRERFLSGIGCPSCNWGNSYRDTPPEEAEAMSVLVDVLGDDIDGIAAEMEDLVFYRRGGIM